MTAFLHWLSHVTGCDYGFRYGTFNVYDMLSGIGGAFPDVMIPAGMLAWYYQHSCHDSPRCLRWGKYPAAGGLFRLCRHHHPDLRGQRPHRELIHRLHAEHKARPA